MQAPQAHWLPERRQTTKTRRARVTRSSLSDAVESRFARASTRDFVAACDRAASPRRRERLRSGSPKYRVDTVLESIAIACSDLVPRQQKTIGACRHEPRLDRHCRQKSRLAHDLHELRIVITVRVRKQRDRLADRLFERGFVRDHFAAFRFERLGRQGEMMDGVGADGMPGPVCQLADFVSGHHAMGRARTRLGRRFDRAHRRRAAGGRWRRATTSLD